jgi:RNA polymerase sigma factor (sigma-70 family)
MWHMSTVTQRSPIRRPSVTPYEEHRAYVLNVLGKRCRWIETEEREALLHDAYVVFLEKLENGKLDGAMPSHQVRAYLTQTALHKALDERKRRQRRSCVPFESDDGSTIELSSIEPSVDDRVIARARDAKVRQEISRLPRRRQLVVVMRWWLGISPAEIQSQLGLSERVYRHELERGTRAVIQSAGAWC